MGVQSFWTWYGAWDGSLGSRDGWISGLAHDDASHVNAAGKPSARSSFLYDAGLYALTSSQSDQPGRLT